MLSITLLKVCLTTVDVSSLELTCLYDCRPPRISISKDRGQREDDHTHWQAVLLPKEAVGYAKYSCRHKQMLADSRIRDSPADSGIRAKMADPWVGRDHESARTYAS